MRPAPAAPGSTDAGAELRSSTMSPSSATTHPRGSTPAASAVRACAASMRNSPWTGRNERGRVRLTCRVDHVARGADVLLHRAAWQAHLAAVLERGAEHALHAVDVRAEHRPHHASLRLRSAENARQGLSDFALRGALAGPFRV